MTRRPAHASPKIRGSQPGARELGFCLMIHLAVGSVLNSLFRSRYFVDALSTEVCFPVVYIYLFFIFCDFDALSIRTVHVVRGVCF